MHHLEVIEVGDDGDEVVTLFVLAGALVDLVKPMHNCLKEMGSYLEWDTMWSASNDMEQMQNLHIYGGAQ